MNFGQEIITWYNANKRDLPWRNTSNPYYIWLSEVILQQTQVKQGKSYYLKFIERFPTVNKLAEAQEEDVLNLWQGLGYYSRARNLHKAARQIVEEYKGKFPKSYSELITLQGVGDYTASAIASIAFKEQVAVVDGNVYRVLSRFFNINTPIDTSTGKKQFKTLAFELLGQHPSGEFNQALMELGALICLPKQAKCSLCPLAQSCEALNKNNVYNFPVKAKKIKQKIRHFNFLVIENNGQYYLEQRTQKDIWQNLYQFPLIETPNKATTDPWENNNFILIKQKEVAKHVLSHQIIYAVFWHYKTTGYKVKTPENWILTDNLNSKPLPRLIERYIELV